MAHGPEFVVEDHRAQSRARMVLVMASLAACSSMSSSESGMLALEERDFGAFAISLPHGEVAESSGSGDVGREQITAEIGHVLVGWQRLTEPTRKETFIDAVSSGFPVGLRVATEGTIQVGDLSGLAVELVGQAVVVRAGLLRCPNEVEVTVIVGGRASDKAPDRREQIRANHEAIVRRIRCSEGAPQ